MSSRSRRIETMRSDHGKPAWLIFTVLAIGLFVTSCAVESGEIGRWEKRYIPEPRQQKIPASETALRVCADPNNLPFSNDRGEGFENKIAELISSEMHLPIEYTWWAERRGFFRNTLRSGKCDVVIGVPQDFELAATTKPYYRSTYVFVMRSDRGLKIDSLDDPELRTLKIGVQLVGDDGTNTPPAHALANRGLIENVRGYTLYGNYNEEAPPSRIINAVARGDVDIAIVWGPLAGYFAQQPPVSLELRPVKPEMDLPSLPFVYDISVGVRRGENELKTKIDNILDRKRAAINEILDEFHVPRADGGTPDT